MSSPPSGSSSIVNGGVNEAFRIELAGVLDKILRSPDIKLDRFDILKTYQDNCVGENNSIPKEHQFQCLFTPDSRKKLRDLIFKPDFSNYLQKKQNFNSDEVSEFINFFKDLESSSHGL
jgi:hypothetical protein